MSSASQVRELAQVAGIRDNQLVGYGVVVGLNGTGDKRQTVFSTQSLANLLQRFQVSVPANAIQVKNTAVVLVTATLPPFARSGSRMDISVAAVGDSTSLRGGILILTPLKAADGGVYAAAQGSLVVGGYTAGAAGTTQTVNHPTTARVPGGALIERDAPSVMPTGQVMLQLRRADFEDAVSIARALNERFAQPVSQAASPGEVRVTIPNSYSGREAEFMADVESVEVRARRPRKIVVNERTGTIALGADVAIRPTSVLHGGLTIQIRTELAVSQPSPLASGETTVVPRVEVEAKEDKAKALDLSEGATVRDLVRALTKIGANARDIIAILESLRAANAFDAEIEVM